MKDPLNIVCMGGGTGLPQLLMGLKLLSREPGSHHVELDRITAIVTAFDDGGSSGRIVEAYRTLPPGDLRNCLLALADERTEPLMTRFFDHRFREDEHEALAGHSVGNLLLLALAQAYGGDIRKALLSIRSVLPIHSSLLFPTLSQAVLCARLTDGTLVRGESHIAQRDDRAPIAEVFLEHRDPSAGPGFPPMEGVLEAIATADLITLGPGSLYTSILPHFLVDGVAGAVRSSQARKVYVCNLMTEAGETDGFRVSDHVMNLERGAGIRIDAVIANSTPVSDTLRHAYERERLQLEFNKVRRGLEKAFERALEHPDTAPELKLEADRAQLALTALSTQLSQVGAGFVQVLPDAADRLPDHVRLITADLLADVEVTEKGGTKRVIRHDPMKLARALLKAVEPTRRLSPSWRQGWQKNG
jgi:uncharacterized cofD-like protein